MDFVRICSFRRSLLTHQGVPIKRNLDADVLNGLYLASAGQYESRQPSLAQGVTETFYMPGGPRTIPSTGITKAALLFLTEQWPLAIPFSQLLDGARSKLARVPDSLPDTAALAHQATLLGNELLHCYAAGVIELRMQPPRLAGRPSVRPTASPLARLDAERGDLVTNLRHETLRVDDFLRRLLRLLDGTRDRDALVDALVVVNAGAVIGALRHGSLPAKDPNLEKSIRSALDEGLLKLARAGLLLN